MFQQTLCAVALLFATVGLHAEDAKEISDLTTSTDASGYTYLGSRVITKAPSSLNGEVTLSSDVVAIAPDAFKDCSAITSISLPSSLKFLNYSTQVAYNLPGYGTAYNSESGDTPNASTTHRTITVDIKKGDKWAVFLDVPNPTNLSWNKWGSGLFATGSDATASSYSNGLQLYLTVDNVLKIVYNGTWDPTLSIADVSKGFTVSIEYNGSQFTVVMTGKADGLSASFTSTIEDGYTFNDISQFSYATAAGLDIDAYIFTGKSDVNPFSGCSSLTKITTADNSNFTVTDNILYTSANEPAAFAEANWWAPYFRLSYDNDGVTYSAYAEPTGNSDGTSLEASATNREVLFDSAAKHPGSSLWQLNGSKIQNLNSTFYLGGPDYYQEYKVSVTYLKDWGGTFSYTSYLTNLDKTSMRVSLTASNMSLCHNGTDLKFQTTDTPEKLIIEKATTIQVQLDSEGLALIGLPVAVKSLTGAPQTLKITGVQSGVIQTGNYANGETINAKTGFLLNGGYGAVATLEIDQAAATAASEDGNILSCTTYCQTIDAGSYILGDAKLVKTAEATTIAANTAYISADDISSDATDTLTFGNDVTTSIREVDSENATLAATDGIVYDLQGRRVAGTPRRGLYIVNGRLTYLR